MGIWRWRWRWRWDRDGDGVGDGSDGVLLDSKCDGVDENIISANEDKLVQNETDAISVLMRGLMRGLCVGRVGGGGTAFLEIVILVEVSHLDVHVVDDKKSHGNTFPRRGAILHHFLCLCHSLNRKRIRLHITFEVHKLAEPVI